MMTKEGSDTQVTVKACGPLVVNVALRIRILGSNQRSFSDNAETWR